MAFKKDSHKIFIDTSTSSQSSSGRSTSSSPEPAGTSTVTTPTDEAIFKGNVWANQIEFRQWKQHIEAQLKEMEECGEVAKTEYLCTQIDDEALDYLRYTLEVCRDNKVSVKWLINRLTEKYDPVISMIDIRFG